MKKKLLILAALVLTLACVLSLGALTVSAEEAEPSVTIAKFNLAFEDNTYLKYAVRFDGVADSAITENNIGMLYWTDYADGFVPGTEDFSSKTTGYTEISGVKHYVFEYTHLAAKQLTDYVYSIAYIELDGTTYYSEPVKYSALEYAYNRLGKTSEGSTNTELKALLNNMLAYGASAQQYFDYKEDRLATDDFYQITIVGGTLDDGFASGLYLSTDKVTITATANNGYTFSGWYSNDELVSEDAEYSFTALTKNYNFVAKFEKTEVVKLAAGLYDENDNLIASWDTLVNTYGMDVSKDHDFSGSTSAPYYVLANNVELSGGVKLIISDSVTSIGDFAFYYCSSLTSVVIGDNVTSIGYAAFCCCTSLTSIVIPDSVTSIGEGAFSYCYSLVSIEVPESNTAYKSIDGNLYTKDGKTLIRYAIGKTDTSFTVPDSVTSIGNYAFFWCSSLTSVVIGDSVTSIGESAFYNCSSLTSIVIPDSVTSIGSYAFYYCTSLTSIVIPDGVTSIGSYAFYYCSSLTSIVIPENVTSIAEWAFSGCYKLVEVINKSSLNITAGSWNNGDVAYYAIEVHNGESKIVNKDDYLLYTYDGINYLFGYVGDETKLTLPENYNGEKYEIYNYAFWDCSSLTSIVIPDSVTSIGNRAFEDCSSLTSVVIGDSVTSIGDFAFRDCSSLTSIVIPDSVTSIGMQAFYGCTSLTSVVIGDSVTSIGYCAFSGCTSLTSVVIPDSVTSIGVQAFYGCTSLTDVYYTGSEEEWAAISIGDSNDSLTNATRYYYSETAPTVEGNFWRYVNGVPTPW